MKRQGFFCTFLLMAMCLMTSQNVRADEAQGTVKDVDICIYGSTPAGIKVAQYMTELPPREVLIRQIQKSLEAAKAHFDDTEDSNAPALPLGE